ncbi:MAG: cell division protein ZapA [Gammaproteobacteria bacterium]
MASSDTQQVKVHILDHDYQVACPPEERDALIRAADYLSQNMAEVRDSGRVVGMDRIAVMVALNLAHQYLGAEEARKALTEVTTQRIEKMRLTLVEAGEKGAAY